jgi:hypothetical protein
MVTTIDGRIMGGRWGKVAGQKGSANIFETTAATYRIPSWLVGTTTMKEFAGRPIKIRKTKDKIVREDHVVTRDAMGYAIGADRKGVLPWSTGRAQHSAFVKCLRQLGKEPESSSDTVHTQHNHAPRDRRRCHCRSEDAVRPRAFDRTAHEDITHI